MGRAARNHGGTGGHGYFPLPGEKPNYNRHIIIDQTLLSLVTNKNVVGPMDQQAGKKKASSLLEMPSVKLSMSKGEQNLKTLDSEQQEVASVKQPQMQQQLIASDKQTTPSVQQKPVPPVKVKEVGDISSTQLSTGCGHQTIPSEQIPVALAKMQKSQVQQKPVTSDKQSIPLVQVIEAGGLSSPQLPVASGDHAIPSGQLTLVSEKRQQPQVQQKTLISDKQSFISAQQKPVQTEKVQQKPVTSDKQSIPLVQQKPVSPVKVIEAGGLSSPQLPVASGDQAILAGQLTLVSAKRQQNQVQQKTMISDKQPFTSAKQKPNAHNLVLKSGVQVPTESPQQLFLSQQLEVSPENRRQSEVLKQSVNSYGQPFNSVQQKPVLTVKQPNSQLQNQAETPDIQSFVWAEQKPAPLEKVMEAGVLSSMQLPTASVQQPVPQNSFTQQLQMPVHIQTEQLTSGCAQQFVSTSVSYLPPHFAPQVPSCFDSSFLAYQIPVFYPIQYYWIPDSIPGVLSVSPLVSNQVTEGYSSSDQWNFQHESSQQD